MKNSKTKLNILAKSLVILLLAVSLSSCGITDVFVFQNDGNTVSGLVDLSDRISEEAKKGADEVTLYVENTGEDEIKQITDNMGLFWGTPTEYTILKAKPQDDTLKIKFYIEKTNNYYAVKNYTENEPIPEGNDEAAAIVKEIDSVLDEVIEDDMSDYDKEIALHDWLVENLEYDDGIDAASTENGSYGGLVNKKTMCRGYAEAMKILSECCDLETKVIVGRAVDEKGDTVGHAWNLVKLDGKWYHLDVTYDDPVGDDSGNIHYFYFNLNDTDTAKDHTWDSDYFPACDNDSYMYYKKNDLYYSSYYDFKFSIKETISYDKPSYIEVLLDAHTIYESELRFVFDIPEVKSISWNTHSSSPVVVMITPYYY